MKTFNVYLSSGDMVPVEADGYHICPDYIQFYVVNSHEVSAEDPKLGDYYIPSKMFHFTIKEEPVATFATGEWKSVLRAYS